MRKLFLFLFVVSCGLISCEGPMGPEGPQGESGYGTSWNVETFTIRANQWQKITDGDDTYYRAVVDLKYPGWQLTDKDLNDIYEVGTLLAYMFRTEVNGQGQEVETQVLLPYVVNWSNEYNETQAEVFYFNYTPYDVAFYFATSGDNADAPPAYDYTFRVVVQW